MRPPREPYAAGGRVVVEDPHVAQFGTDEPPPGQLEGHINAAEFWLMQADNYNFPDPIRTECLQLASTHACLAQAVALATQDRLPQ